MLATQIWFALVAALVGMALLGSVHADAASHWRIEVKVEPSQHRIWVQAETDRMPTPRFYLHEDLVISRILSDGAEVMYARDDSSETAPYTSRGKLVQLDIAAPMPLVIEYEGILDGVESNVNMVTPDLVELAYYTCWYPVIPGSPGFTFDLRLDMPGEFVVTTNGRQVESNSGDGRRMTRWLSFGEATDVVVVASPSLQVHRLQTDLIEVETLYSGLDREIVAESAAQLKRSMEELSALYGAPGVTGYMRFVYSPREGWGYSRIPVFVVPERYQQSLEGDEVAAADALHGAVHELAHFWWRIADPGSPSDWINEGLAEYSAFRLSNLLSGAAYRDILLARYRSHAREGGSDVPIAMTPQEADVRYLNRYERTTLMFDRAARQFGQEAVDGLLRFMHATHVDDRSATTESFLADVERQLGVEARSFFEACLFDPTNPVVMGQDGQNSLE